MSTLLAAMSPEERAEVEASIARNDLAATEGPRLTGELLGLPGWSLLKPPRMVGDSLDLYFSHPDRGHVTLTFQSRRDFTTPRSLAERLAVECGRRGKPPTLENIFTALALIGEMAVRHETESEDEVARGWGESFLEQVGEHSLDWSDQEERWQALVDVRDADATIKDELRHAYYAARHSVVVAHAFVIHDSATRRRFVHAGWFASHVRDQGATVSRGAISQAMRRVGWERTDSMKLWAREPGGTGRKLSMRAYVVPADWSRE